MVHYRKPNPEDGKTYKDHIKEQYSKLTPEELKAKGMSEYCVAEVIRNLK